jgi:hypothetical protein
MTISKPTAVKRTDSPRDPQNRPGDDQHRASHNQWTEMKNDPQREQDDAKNGHRFLPDFRPPLRAAFFPALAIFAAFFLEYPLRFKASYTLGRFIDLYFFPGIHP